MKERTKELLTEVAATSDRAPQLGRLRKGRSDATYLAPDYYFKTGALEEHTTIPALVKTSLDAFLRPSLLVLVAKLSGAIEQKAIPRKNALMMRLDSHLRFCSESW